ncbi:MAG: imidazole glycerol phosphate synthase subunit HisH [Rhodospirillaceae bacterium]|jgi:imidazole glycerol-phosphate synthase subunit HisH|nr:imidazole glycerol phosphate synthase subunit HisH [Rhodospirillaceae bacterium]
MSVAIIDYGSGNLRSAAKSFERGVAEDGLTLDVLVTADPDQVRKASHIVLPGVGAFGDCRRGLMALDGMVDALTEAAIKEAKPFFGICVGMQLMATYGREHGDHEGLGWLEGEVRELTPTDKSLKIPHMGWNVLDVQALSHPLFQDLGTDAHVYFVHSYHMACESSADILATTEYGGPVTAAVGRDNLVGTQFHPEKSQKVGLKLISNFLKWKP